MKIAFAFAGQGAEVPRMGIEMAEAHEPARTLIAATGRSIADKLARGRALSRTSELQPALVAVSLGALSALADRGIRPCVVLGHSLGEIAAWSATGSISAVSAVHLAARRGEAMERQASLRPGGMLSLRDCDLAGVVRALEAGRAAGELSVAAHNAARTWVLSGDAAALRAAARVSGGVQVPVTGPWHAASMAGAIPAFAAALAEITSTAADSDSDSASDSDSDSDSDSASPHLPPMITNATGTIIAPARVPARLAGQLARPVRWVRSMRTLAHLGVTDVITPGPAKALRHFMREGLPTATLHACETPDDVERLANRFERC